MPGALRSIAVTVEEPAPDAFEWLLLEKMENGRWSVLERSDQAFRRYHKAMAAGLLALQAMIADLDAGPRHSGEEEQEEAGATTARQTGLFGFGGLPP